MTNHYAPDIVINLPKNKFEIHYKFIRNLEHFDLEPFITDFNPLVTDVH